MPTTHPVVVYGASGYTGRLVCEYLKELRVPFTAAGRDGDRVAKVVEAIGGIETIEHESVGVEHDVASLAALFEGAQVVCNTVGPFATLGMPVAEACAQVGAHYLDTTGEQDWMLDVQAALGERYAEQGLVLLPGLAHMYTACEIAANIALEEPGYDTLDLLVLWKGAPTTASTETILTNLMSDAYYVEDNEYVAWGPIKGHDVVVPGQHGTALALPWGGTGNPVWFKDDPRVANCKALGGIYDRGLMETVLGVAQMVEADIKPLPDAEREQAITAVADQMRAPMPPRENPRINRSIDSVHATGPLGHAHVVLHGNCNYKQTGLMQADAARQLVLGTPRRSGFVSGCQAFGHRELLGTLQAFGLQGRPSVVRV